MAPSIPNRPALCGCGNPTHSPLVDCRLSPEREAEIRNREAAATPGPWTADDWEINAPSGWVAESYDADDGAKSCINAAFIAHARQDVPDLLAEISRLRERVAELEAAMAAEPRAADGAVDALFRAIQDAKGGVA